jgi:hypothetical protein
MDEGAVAGCGQSYLGRAAVESDAITAVAQGFHVGRQGAIVEMEGKAFLAAADANGLFNARNSEFTAHDQVS